MKKLFFLPLAVLLFFGICLFSQFSSARETEQAMDGVIRLHVRAEDDSSEEQALKLKVRDGILNCTNDLLKDCASKAEARQRLQANLDRLAQAGQRVVREAGKNHSVSVCLERESFEYREYDGFFLPKGEYDSLIVNVGSGRGQNWWCVVFPAACYMGAAEVETDATRMPECFQLAKQREESVTVKFWLRERVKEIFR
ncbi:MAG: stage II sporulation protein R [Clostridia bacterium]|nr:stage II sporulation protein R [Clostridia bacterium]